MSETHEVAKPANSKGLKSNAIGFWDGLAIGLDSTAPAYSLAAVLGSMVVLVGTKAPAVLLVSFIPMFLIAGAFYYMNRADQDCGTTFSWVTRAMGPWVGWMGGWAIFTTGILVIGAQADVSAYYIFDLLGLEALRDSRPAVVIFAVLIIVIMTWICVIGTEASAMVQRVMVLAQVGAVLLFVGFAIVAMMTGNVADDAPQFSFDWLNPIGVEPSALISGMLLGVFIYWGWESAVNLTEESENSESAPGAAGVISTVVLVVTYVATAVAIIGTAGLATIESFDDDAGLFGAVARQVMGPFGFVLVLSIITSGLASTQTTILPASRTSLSMAVSGAFPKYWGKVHPKFETPAIGTWIIGIVAIAWYVGASIISDNFLFDSLTALSIVVAFYYALTGIACAIYWRRELRRSVKAFLLVGLGPIVGSVVLLWLLVQAAIEQANPENSYTGTSVFGVGAPLVIAIGLFVLGVVLMIVWRLSPDGRAFFTKKGGESVSEEVAFAALGPIQTRQSERS
ncbi:APC family permease [Humidisolicoccus flavus]|uniref:APC family permease n=1 Tax=Humidisolicoccus flavus TaxID=3111414 RepID=UPI00324771DB